MDLKAVILAAGQGKRLMPLTSELPKSLLDIKGKSILERILDNLLECGINEAAIVVGFQEEKIRGKIGTEYRGIRVTYITNPLYKITNNIFSVWLCHEYGREGFLLINGDDVFDSKILHNIVNSEHANAAVIDLSKTNLPEEAMKATVKNGLLTAVSKKIPPSETSGDAIGIYKFSEEGATRLFTEIKQLLLDEQHNTFYLVALDKLIKNFEFHAIATEDTWWDEIDDLNDYNNVLARF